MALSLTCEDCGLALRNVQEVQAHSDATGHSSFAESTEKVKIIECQECGKPCRTADEQDLHTRRTGHASFKEKDDGDVPLETEAQMKEAARKIKEADAEILKAAKKLRGVDTAEEDPADKPGTSGSPEEEQEMVPAEVDADTRQQLEGMGFSTNKSTRALHFTKGSLEEALNWLEEHASDPDIDESLLIPKKDVKPKLSPEEARKLAEETIKKVKLQKEREQKALEKIQEQERVRFGKEIQAAQKLEADLQLKRNVEARRIEKEEVARAKEKIRLKLAEDRAERRRKLGLPEQLTPEEEARERAKQAEKDAAQRKKPLVAPKPITGLESMRQALVDMKKQCAGDDARAKLAFETLMKYVGNVYQNPGEEKFRRIKLSNAAFQQRVASLTGSLDFLKHLGFVPDAEGAFLCLPDNKASPALLSAAGELLSNAITNPMFGVL